MTEQLKTAKIKIPVGEIPITLFKETDGDEDYDCYYIEIDGVEWLETGDITHAIVMFTMMQEHIAEYMHYQMWNM